MIRNFALTLSPRSVSTSQHLGFFVERRRGHARVEHDMPAQIEAIGNMVGIGEDFRLRRVLLRPVPLLVQFLREGERILHALDVATRAGITVPVPGAADATAGLEHPCRKAKPAQAMQHVHSGKARTDDNGVENRPDFGRVRSSRCGVGSHGSAFPRVVSMRH